MILTWLKKIFFNTKKRDENIGQLIKESRVVAAELAIFKEAETKRLKARLTKTQEGIF